MKRHLQKSILGALMILVSSGLTYFWVGKAELLPSNHFLWYIAVPTVILGYLYLWYEVKHDLPFIYGQHQDGGGGSNANSYIVIGVGVGIFCAKSSLYQYVSILLFAIITMLLITRLVIKKSDKNA